MGTRAATGQVKLVVTNNITNTMTDGQEASATLDETVISGRLTSGVSEQEYNRGWTDERTIASGGSEDIDLFDLGTIDVGAGAGLDALGQAWAILEIVTLIITQTAGPGRLQINATDPTNKVAWMPTLTVANGGAGRPPTTDGHNWTLAMHNPHSDAFPITDASSHMVRFGASGGAVTYQIHMLARHDVDESSSSSSSTKSTLSSSTSSSTSSISSVSSSSSSSSSSSHSRSSSSVSSASSSSTSTLSSLSSSSSSSSHSISTSSTLSSSSTSTASSSSTSSASSSSTSSTLSSSSSSSFLQ